MILNNLIILNILKNIKENGAYEWLLVRFSAVVIFLYSTYLVYFIFSVNFLTYEVWYDFFSKQTTKIFNFITLFSILIHSWIGISHILMDYVKNPPFKYILKIILVVIFFMYLFFGMSVIWSI